MVEDSIVAKLEVHQGIDINEPICPPDTDTGEHQVNFPSGIINTLHNTQFMDPALKNRIPTIRDSKKYEH